MKIESISVHAGQEIECGFGALTKPIYLTSTYERNADGSYPHGYQYSRNDNPNRKALEDCISHLEYGEDAAAFSSGSAAVMSVVQALSPGDHIIAPEDMYYGIKEQLTKIFVPWGIELTFTDMTDVRNVETSMKTNTKMIMIETPSNPMIKVVDIGKVSNIIKGKNIILLADNTAATPVLQNPIALGADLVIHSTTKSLGGHSDVLGGIVITKEKNDLWEKIRFIQRIGGAVPSPFECWLALRGINTLAYRVRAQSESAMKIALYLDSHPKIGVVHYPGLENNPFHEIAEHQMNGFGGLMSFQMTDAGAEKAMKVAAGLELITRATSFGGTHTVIEHRASIEAEGTTTPQNLLRLSVGLENTDDLLADLDQALVD